MKGLGVLPTGAVLAVGEFYPQVAFGPTILTAVGSGDLFMGRIGQVMGLPDEARSEYGGEVWPNPAREAVWLRAPLGEEGTATVIDALGRLARTVTLGAGVTRLDCRGLLGGVYTVLFRAKGARATRKLVIQP